MRVVHIGNLPLPPDHPDYGRVSIHPGRWVLHLALAQMRHTDIRPELVVQVPGATRDHHTRVDGVPVHFLAAPTRFRSATLFWFDARRIARRIRSLQPDLVHAHGTEDAYGLAAQRTGLPCVITAQGLHFLINSILPPSPFSRERVVQFTERFCLRRTRHVIAKSQYVHDALRDEFPHLQLHEIPNTFDPRLQSIQERRETDTIIFVAAIDPRKGLHHLRGAMGVLKANRPSLALWIVGNRIPSRSEYEAAEIRALREIMGERLKLWGTLPAMEVASLMARASLLVAPSLEEMFGNQVIEALLLGTPVVVTEGTALAENVRRFGNGRVTPQADPPALAEAILKTLNEPSSLEMIESARQAIHAWMSPERVARLHREVYEIVMK